MEGNARLDSRTVMGQSIALDRVSDEVPNGHVWILEGEIYVGQEVHLREDTKGELSSFILRRNKKPHRYLDGAGIWDSGLITPERVQIRSLP